MSVADLEAMRDVLVTALTSAGKLSTPELRSAFRVVPRDVFVPYFFVQNGQDGTWALVERPGHEWLAGVHGTGPLITQLDGDERRVEQARQGEPVTGEPTSSSSAPTLMALMLDALAVHHGDRVLEIGTGTGYNAALLCALTGAENVTSVDVDRDLVERARARLAVLGLEPSLHTADGSGGVPARGPFDRVIATVGMNRVPAAIIDQTADGGLILVPFNRRDRSGLLALLTVHAGTAQGHFLPDYGGFMGLRGDRVNAAKRALRETAPDDGIRETAYLTLDMVIGASAEPFEFFAALTILGGGWDRLEFTPHGSDHSQTWLAQQDGSWVCCMTNEDGPPTVRQGGPRRLWDHIERAYSTWHQLGRPPRERFGLTVTNGEHIAWLDSPDSDNRWVL